MSTIRFVSLSLALAFASAPIAAQAPDAALLNAATSGQITQVKSLLAQGANANIADRNGWTPLMRAAELGHAEVARALLDNGAKLNMKQRTGWTALLLACRSGHADVVKMLLDSKAGIDQKIKGKSAFHFAAESGCAGCLGALLLRKKDQINQKDNDGQTPLLLAARAGKPEAVKILLTNKAKVGARSKDNWTPLLAATQGGHTECVRALIAAKANAKVKRKGVSALRMAEIGGHSEVAQLLREAGAKN